MTSAQMILFAVFFFAVGACVGSFLNVVIWRLPHRGREVAFMGKTGKLTLSWPPSHCPMCDSPIAWYQNLPVLSYIFLRARCAKCRAHIPIRYPLVELATSLLWGGMFLAYFVSQWQATPCAFLSSGKGIDAFPTDWPVYVWHLVMVSALLAASATDADLFIIPLAIPWFLVAWGLVGAGLLGKPLLPKQYALVPELAVSGWWLAKPILGIGIGLVIANVLLLLNILPRSFPWELEAQEEAEKKDASAVQDKGDRMAPLPKLTRYAPTVIGAVVVVAATIAMWIWASPRAAGIAGVVGAIVVFLLGVMPRDADQIDVTEEVVEEISVEGVRREIMKEVLFLAIPLALAAVLYVLPFDLPQIPWLARVLGSLLGLIAGGGVIWLFRIAGSLALNKQAMGIGDIHLMAGVGAVIGAPLVLLASIMFGPVTALLWIIVLKLQGKPGILQFGPWLSIASILVLILGHPAICAYMTILMPVR